LQAPIGVGADPRSSLEDGEEVKPGIGGRRLALLNYLNFITDFHPAEEKACVFIAKPNAAM